jgi:hypothetical protein
MQRAGGRGHRKSESRSTRTVVCGEQRAQVRDPRQEVEGNVQNMVNGDKKSGESTKIFDVLKCYVVLWGSYAFCLSEEGAR